MDIHTWITDIPYKLWTNKVHIYTYIINTDHCICNLYLGDKYVHTDTVVFIDIFWVHNSLTILAVYILYFSMMMLYDDVYHNNDDYRYDHVQHLFSFTIAV